MRVGRLDTTRSIHQLLGLRKGPEIDVAPVVVSDWAPGSPHPPFQTWLASGSLAGGVGLFNYAALSNIGPNGGYMCLDGFRYRLGAAAAVYLSFIDFATIQATLGVGQAVMNFRQPGKTSADASVAENFNNVSAQIVSSASNFAQALIDPRSNAAGEMLFDMAGFPVVVGEQRSVVLKFNLANTSLDFCAWGRYYDPA